jgi:hypothetical protein
MMRGMADGHPFADLDANDDGAVELTRSGRTAASLSTCPRSSTVECKALLRDS